MGAAGESEQLVVAAPDSPAVEHSAGPEWATQNELYIQAEAVGWKGALRRLVRTSVPLTRLFLGDDDNRPHPRLQSPQNDIQPWGALQPDRGPSLDEAIRVALDR